MPPIEAALPSRREQIAKHFDLESPVLELSTEALHEALRHVALEDLAIARARYSGHRDPTRCAVSISLVLRSLAKEIYGERKVGLLRGISWLNFLLRTSDASLFRPHVIETMSAALYDDPAGVPLPSDCGFWFDAAESWIRHQAEVDAIRHP